MYKLRQRIWGVFIRPYVEYGGGKLVQRGSLSVGTPCRRESEPCPQYVPVKDGEAWMLYKGEYLTSFVLVREKVKEIMDELGFSKNDIMVAEITPFDHVVTPLS